MSIRFIGGITLIIVAIIPLSIHANWVQGGCDYFQGSVLKGFGGGPTSVTKEKLNGIWTFCVREEIKPYDTVPVATCLGNPNGTYPSDPSSTMDPLGCWSNCSVSGPSVTCTGGYNASGACMGFSSPYWTVGGCGQPDGAFTHKVDGSPFRAGNLYFGVCNPTNSLSPNKDLIVYTLYSKQYKYDDIKPTCVRGGFSPAVLSSLGSDFLSDAQLNQKKIDLNTTIVDTTLTYTGTIYTASPRSYRGEWTNQIIRGMGLCFDEHSGCKIGTLPAISEPLIHKQLTFPIDPVFLDNAENASVGTCNSSSASISKIIRKCKFEINKNKIESTIADSEYETDYNGFTAADKAFLQSMIDNPPQGTDPSFSPSIKKLRELSYLLDPDKHDLFYVSLGNCSYIPSYSTDLTIPLIDRIKPTIKIEAQIGAGIATPDVLLEQEGTSTAGVPKISNTGSYLAGSGVIMVTITDAGTSTFTDNAVWDKYDGISGFDGYDIRICRTKTHTGMVLNADCSSASASHIISGEDLASVFDIYNPTGAVTLPQVIELPIEIADTDVDGIQVAGEYQVYVGVLDRAGNKNIATAVFNVVPEGFDPTRTRLDKYSDPIIESSTTTIYTVSGTTRTPGAAATTDTPSYANAIDTQTYKMSIFDNYGNPIYNWKLYDFVPTKTDIYLDQVDKDGGNALFIGASGGTSISNLPQLGTTDGNGALKFNIYSYTPGEFLEQFKFTYRNWDRYRVEAGSPIPYTFPALANTSSGSFYHIFTGSVDLYTTNRIDLGTANDVMMSFFATSNTPNTTLTSFKVGNFLESIKSMSPDDFVITNTGLAYDPDYEFDSHYPDPTYLSGATGSFIPEQKGTLFTSNLKVEAYPYITLTFSGQTTRYYVSNKQNKFGSGILYDTGSLNRIYIDGLTSTVGKNGYVNNKDNVITNSADTRNAIHKNVALLLRNRTTTAGGGIINRVKYMEGDVKSSTLGDISTWDVLIIKGGDFIIGDDYNDPTDLSTKPLESRNYSFNGGTDLKSVAHKGIIVLKDTNNVGGNIYIKPDVRFIGASLFADESIMSVKYNATTFDKSNSARTFLLDKQLVIFGNVLSKNTVGGAVRANTSGQYTLPWQNTTVSLDEAVNFDLAFLRMDNSGYDDPGVLNAGHNEFVVILTDPRNISNPLPGFLIKK